MEKILTQPKQRLQGFVKSALIKEEKKNTKNMKKKWRQKVKEKLKQKRGKRK